MMQMAADHTGPVTLPCGHVANNFRHDLWWQTGCDTVGESGATYTCATCQATVEVEITKSLSTVKIEELVGNKVPVLIHADDGVLPSGVDGLTDITDPEHTELSTIMGDVQPTYVFTCNALSIAPYWLAWNTDVGPINKTASDEVGHHVTGGVLHGPVLLTPPLASPVVL